MKETANSPRYFQNTTPTLPKTGKLCEALPKSELAPCNTQTCETECRDGTFSDWSGWSMCTATCGSGYRFRSREVDLEPNHCGKVAAGPLQEFEPCEDNTPCQGEAQDCEFSEWSDYGDCSCECNGVKERSRRVVKYPRGDGAKACEGPLKQLHPCNVGSCALEKPIDCVLGEWTDFSLCNAPCDGGTRERKFWTSFWVARRLLRSRAEHHSSNQNKHTESSFSHTFRQARGRPVPEAGRQAVRGGFARTAGLQPAALR